MEIIVRGGGSKRHPGAKRDGFNIESTNGSTSLLDKARAELIFHERMVRQVEQVIEILEREQ
jgi:hypothetical protein